MKRTLLAAAIAGALSLPVCAAELELYGIVDTGLTYTHSSDNDIDTFEMSSGNYAGSRFGLRGTEKISEDLSVAFILESGFNSDSGSYSEDGVIFNRESQINVSGPWGTLGFGRVGAFSSATSSLGWGWDLDPFETGYIDAGIQATQVNTWRVNSNTVYYISPIYSGFKLGLQYSFTGTNTQEEQEFSDNDSFANAVLRWDGTNVRTMLGVEWERFGKPDADSSKRRDDALGIKFGTAWNIAGGPATAYFGASWYKNYSRFSDSTWADDEKVQFDPESGRRLDAFSVYIGGKYSIGAADLLALIQYMDGENKGAVAGDEKDFERYVLSVGCHYHISNRTMLYVIASYADGSDLFDELTGGTDTDRYMGHIGLTHTF